MVENNPEDRQPPDMQQPMPQPEQQPRQPVAPQSTQQPSQQPTQQQPQQPQPPQKHGFFFHPGKTPPQPSKSIDEAANAPKAKKRFPIIPAAILIIILILLLALLLSRSSGPSAPAGSQSSADQAQLLAALSSPSNQTPAAVTILASKRLASSSQFNISYSGIANVRANGGALGNLNFQIPLRVSYEKYGNDSRLHINATGIPLIGSISAYYIGLSNGTSYSCSAFGGGLFSNLSANSSGRITCQASQSIEANQYLSLLQAVRGQQGMGGSAKVLGSEVYNGQGCVLTRISGNASVANYTVSYNLTTCLSSQYYVPLNLTAIASPTSASGYNVSLSLDEFSIGAPVTQAEVTALPGSVSGLQSSFGNTTVNATTTLNYNTPISFVNGTTTCTPPFGNQNTNCLGFTMSPSRTVTLSIETNDYNAYNISVGCEISKYRGAFVNSGFPVYYAINSSGPSSHKGTVGAANDSGTASLLENTPLNFTGLPCSAEATIPSNLTPGTKLSGTIWFNYKNLPSHGVNETGILASFNTTISSAGMHATSTSTTTVIVQSVSTSGSTSSSTTTVQQPQYANVTIGLSGDGEIEASFNYDGNAVYENTTSNSVSFAVLVGTPISLTEIPGSGSSGNWNFNGYSCIGKGCYSGASESPTITVNNNMTEIANFIK